MSIHPATAASISQSRAIHGTPHIPPLFAEQIRANTTTHKFVPVQSGRTETSSIDRRMLSGAGLSHIHIIDRDDERRFDLHQRLSSRADAAVKTYRDGQQFLGQRAELDDGCVLLSIQRFDEHTQDILSVLRLDRRFACIVLTNDTGVHSAIRAMKAGASDYLLLPVTPQCLWTAIDEALLQVRQLQAANAAALRARDQIARLSMREHEVLAGLVAGKSNKMIALELHISPRTIEIYRAHLMEKLGVRTLSDVLKLALTAGVNLSGTEGAQRA